MKPSNINVWEVEVWNKGEEEWTEYQYYTFSDDRDVVFRFLTEDEGGRVDDHTITYDGTLNTQEFIDEMGGTGLIRDYDTHVTVEEVA